MEKQIKKFKVDFNFDWTYGIKIKKLREDLDELEKLGVTEINIEPKENYGCPSVMIEAYVHRIETDEEYQKRIDNENARQIAIKNRELQELERLKSKYGQ